MPGNATRPVVSHVRSGEVTLAVREHSPWAPGKQTVLLVHGYPDQQDVWEPVLAALPHDRLHLVTYDVRGAGASDAPHAVEAYRTERLVEDLTAVVEATVPEGDRVHLVGHDWGSVQLWDAVNEQGEPHPLTGRIASFTSISGPSLDHVRAVTGTPARWAGTLSQAIHSWYIYWFLVPRLPEILWRNLHPQLAWLSARSEGRSATHWGTELPGNAVHGLRLYRANLPRRLMTPGRLRTDVPVLVVHPRHDRFITRAVHDGLERECSDLQRVEVDAGHWVLQSRPDRVAGLVAAHVAAHS